MNSQKSLSELNESVNTSTHPNYFYRLLKFIGPAYLISVGYMDPGNWATDIAGGSKFGYQLLWVLVLSNIIALLFQSFCIKLGIVAKLDLAQASKRQYGKVTNFCLYILAELAIAATDLAEILGMAIGLNLLFGMPILYGVAISVLDTFLILYLQKAGMRKFEAFIIALVGVIGACFLIEMIFSSPDGASILMGLKPTILSTDALYIAIGIIGATVMPHNLYLHTALVQTRKISSDKKSIKEAIKSNIIDTSVALNFALFVNAGILILAASAFHKNGMFEITEIQDAYRYLEPMLGSKWARILFAVALIAAGQSSTLTGTLAGQIVMEGYLNLRIQPWLRRLITRLLAIVPALIFIYYFGETHSGQLLILSQVMLSLQLGFAVIPLIHLVSNKKLMGDFAIGLFSKIAGWVFAGIIVFLNLKLVIDKLLEWNAAGADTLWYSLALVILVAALVLLTVVSLKPIIQGIKTKKHDFLHGSIKHFHFSNEHAIYKNICICVDFSSSDEKAIQMALSIGKEHTHYTLIHTVESTVAGFYGNRAEDQEALEDYKHLKLYQENLVKLGKKCDIHLSYGNAKKEIPLFINQHSFDIVIIGSHGHKMIHDLIFGTTISAIRHQIKTPLLIV